MAVGEKEELEQRYQTGHRTSPEVRRDTRDNVSDFELEYPGVTHHDWLSETGVSEDTPLFGDKSPTSRNTTQARGNNQLNDQKTKEKSFISCF